MKLVYSFFIASLFFVRFGRSETTATLSTLDLEWPKIAGCPSKFDVEHAILRHLEGTKEQTNVVNAKVVIEHVESFRLRLYVRNASGQGVRLLAGNTCESVTDAAVVILALMLGPTSDLTPDELPSIGPLSTAQPTVAPIFSGPSREPSGKVSVKQRTFRLNNTTQPIVPHIGLGFWIPFGVARNPMFGVMVNSEIEFLHLRVNVRAGMIPENRIPLVDNPSQGAVISLVTVGANVGYAFDHNPLEVIPHVGVSEQRLHGRGFGVDVQQSRSAYFPAAQLGETLRWHLSSPISLESTVDLTAPLHRPALLLAPQGEVLRPARLGMNVSLSLSVRF